MSNENKYSLLFACWKGQDGDDGISAKWYFYNGKSFEKVIKLQRSDSEKIIWVITDTGWTTRQIKDNHLNSLESMPNINIQSQCWIGKRTNLSHQVVKCNHSGDPGYDDGIELTLKEFNNS